MGHVYLSVPSCESVCLPSQQGDGATLITCINYGPASPLPPCPPFLSLILSLPPDALPSPYLPIPSSVFPGQAIQGEGTLGEGGRVNVLGREMRP